MTESEDIKAIVKGFVRSLAQAHPALAPLAQAWSEFETHVQNKRINGFLEILRQDIHCIEERIIVLENKLIATGEFPTIIEIAVEKIRREASKDKIRKFSALLTNTLASEEDISYDKKADFLETLDTLTDRDIKILSVFGSNRILRVDGLIDSGIMGGRSDEDMSRLIVSLSKLEARGIVGETADKSGVFVHWGDASHWVNRWRKRVFELLPFGVKFIRALRDPGT